MKPTTRLTLKQKQEISKKPNYKTFFKLILIALPLWLTILLPLTIIYLFIKLLKSKLIKTKKDKSMLAPKIPDDSGLEITKQVKTERQYDLVVFGATGFTGGFLVDHLSNNYELLVQKDAPQTRTPKTLRWAIAGRSQKKLEAVRDRLAKTNPSMKDLPILIADSFKLESIWSMVAQTQVVITTVGPYAVYGNNLVHACAKQGTDYCDITGEINWVRLNVYRYHSIAKETGARMVFSAGCDSVPWDLNTLNLANNVTSGDSLIKVEHLNQGNGFFSGGTLQTIIYMIDGKYTCPIKPRPQFDPLLTVLNDQDNIERSKSILKINNPFGAKRISKTDKRFKAFSVFAGGNSRIVSRSQSLNNYSNKLTYVECSIINNFVNLVNYYVGFLILLTCLVFTPLRNLLLKYKMLPNPGEGPSLEQMENYYIKIETTGYTKKGKKLQSVMNFNDDIAYRGTGILLAECGLCFVMNHEEINQNGGILTPAVAFGNQAILRIEKYGFEFFILDE